MVGRYSYYDRQTMATAKEISTAAAVNGSFSRTGWNLHIKRIINAKSLLGEDFVNRLLQESCCSNVRLVPPKPRTGLLESVRLNVTDT